jgi:hypothetical protein
MALGSTQPMIEMNTRNLPGGKGRPALKADNLTAICDFLENVGASTFRNSIGLHGLVDGFTFYYHPSLKPPHCHQPLGCLSINGDWVLGRLEGK